MLAIWFLVTSSTALRLNFKCFVATVLLTIIHTNSVAFSSVSATDKQRTFKKKSSEQNTSAIFWIAYFGVGWISCGYSSSCDFVFSFFHSKDQSFFVSLHLVIDSIIRLLFHDGTGWRSASLILVRYVALSNTKKLFFVLRIISENTLFQHQSLNTS